MRIKYMLSIFAVLLFLSFNGTAYCDNGLSLYDTIHLVKETMTSSTSDVRKESYGYVRFNDCNLDYNVFGTYPSGGLYDIKFSNIDFSSLNYLASKVSHDYTAFITLNFKNHVQRKEDFKEMTINTVVINVSTDEKAQVLFNAFQHIGELCGATTSPL